MNVGNPIIAPSIESPDAPRAGAAPAVEPDYELIIQPRRGWIGVDWRELLRHHELLYFLIWRDVKVRYKQTVLGVLWAILQPLLATFLLTIIFGRMLDIKMDGLPYLPAVFVAMLPWTFFSNGITQAGQSLVNQQQLLTKIYLPRLFVPTSSVGSGLVDLAVSIALFAIVMLGYPGLTHWTVLFVAPLMVLAVLVTLGVGYLLAALTIAYRDFRYVIPFMVQVWMYASAVVWPYSRVPEKYQLLVAINPMAGLIDAIRSATFGTPFHGGALAVSATMSLALFVFGLFYFRRTERKFADIA